MKPIITVFASILISSFLGIAIIFCAIGYGVKKEKDKYSIADLQMASKCLTFNDSINRIDASCLQIDYQVKDTNAVKVVISASNAALKEIETTLTNGTLLIHYKNADISSIVKKGAHITVVCPSVRKMSLSAGAVIETQGTYTTSLSAVLTSGSILKIKDLSAPIASLDLSSGACADINASLLDSLSIDVSSGATCNIAGKDSCQYVNFEASSGACIQAKRVNALEGEARASSGGRIDCNVVNLSTKASSGGSIDN